MSNKTVTVFMMMMTEMKMDTLDMTLKCTSFFKGLSFLETRQPKMYHRGTSTSEETKGKIGLVLLGIIHVILLKIFQYFLSQILQMRRPVIPDVVV